MSELEEAIAQVRSKITRYSKSKNCINEQNTKAALIQPILRALGWDVEDLDDVHMEYKERSADKPVDYALLLMRSPCAFLEAKSLGSSLDDRKWANQIMGYASVAGVEWVVLCDGDEYRIYNSHATVPVDEKLFRAVRISDPDSNAAETLRLLSKDLMRERQINRMWDVHFVDRQVQTALRQLFAHAGEPDPSIVRLLEKRIAALTAGDIKASLRRIDVQVTCPVTIETTRLEFAEPNRHRSEQAEKAKKSSRKPSKKASNSVSISDLIAAGLIRAPMPIFKDYKGVRLTATVHQDGTIEFDGQRFDSCSTAGAQARGSVVGGAPSTNGWSFWKFDDDGTAVELDRLRQSIRQEDRAT